MIYDKERYFYMMCSKCNKRVATVFVTKIENGQRKTEGLCVRCAKEMGLPTDQIMGNVIGKLGITPEQMESLEQEINGLIQGNLPSDNDDTEDGGAPAIDFPKLIRESGLLEGDPDQEGGNVPLGRMFQAIFGNKSDAIFTE